MTRPAETLVSFFTGLAPIPAPPPTPTETLTSFNIGMTAITPIKTPSEAFASFNIEQGFISAFAPIVN